jgi:hypothetical protein
MKKSEVKCIVHSRWNIDGKVRDIEPGLNITCSTRTAMDMVKAGHAELVKHLDYVAPPETVKEDAEVNVKEPAPENKDAAEKVEEDKKEADKSDKEDKKTKEDKNKGSSKKK